MGLRVDVAIADTTVHNAMIGCAAVVNIIPLHTMKSLGLKLTEPSTHCLRFAGGSESVPVGVIKNVPVDVGRIRILTTFYVLLLQNNSYSLLLGLPWMHAVGLTVKGDEDWMVVEIRGDNETVTVPQWKADNNDKWTSFCSLVEIGRSLTSE